MAKKLSRGVAVVGVGMSKFGVFPEKTSRDLFVEAFQELRQSVQKGFDPRDIEAFTWATSLPIVSRTRLTWRRL